MLRWLCRMCPIFIMSDTIVHIPFGGLCKIPFGDLCIPKIFLTHFLLALALALALALTLALIIHTLTLRPTPTPTF